MRLIKGIAPLHCCVSLPSSVQWLHPNLHTQQQSRYYQNTFTLWQTGAVWVGECKARAPVQPTGQAERSHDQGCIIFATYATWAQFGWLGPWLKRQAETKINIQLSFSLCQKVWRFIIKRNHSGFKSICFDLSEWPKSYVCRGGLWTHNNLSDPRQQWLLVARV